MENILRHINFICTIFSSVLMSTILFKPILNQQKGSSKNSFLEDLEHSPDFENVSKKIFSCANPFQILFIFYDYSCD